MRRFATVLVVAWIATAQLFSQSTACDTAFFSFSDSVFCTGDPVQIPDSVFPMNGFFLGDSGLAVDSLGSIDPGASLPGVYSLTYVVVDSCADSLSVSIEIVSSANAAFGYSDSLFCVPEVDPLPTILGDSGGVFSGSLGLVIDSLSGLVNLGSSFLGSHSVQHAVGGLCPDSLLFSLLIDSTEDASFLFPDSSYCSNGQDPNPLLLGDISGIFQAGSGLAIDSLTGHVDLSQSSAGVYSVMYSTQGNCPDSMSFPMEIIQSQNPAFSYPTSICINDSNPIPWVAVSGGLFSVIGSGLVFADSLTGEIDLSNSQPGSYQVQYRTADPCPDSLTALVILQGQTPALFHYPDTTYCNGSSFAAPVILGQGGGFFFSLDTTIALDSLTGFVDLQASETGAHSICYVSPGTCSDTTSFVLEIAPQGNASYEYIPGQYCVSDPDPIPTVSGDSNGVWSVVFGNALVDSLTGLIDLQGSGPGDSILIQYWVPGIGASCPDSLVRLVRIFAPDSTVTVSYSQSSYCPDEQDPSPIVNGQSGGSFQASPPGLVLASQFTGEIDLSASLPGTYLVRYFPPGACTDTTNGFSLTIHPRNVVSVGYSQSSYCTGEGLAMANGLTDSLGTFYEPSGFLAFADPTLGTIDLDSSKAGAYLVRYVSGGACPEDTVLSLTIYESPDALLISNAEDATICVGDSIDLLAFGGDQFAWFLNDSMVRGFQYVNLFQPYFGLLDGDEVTVRVRNDLGACVDEDSLVVSVRPSPFLSYLVYDSILSGGEALEVTFQVGLDSVEVDWWYSVSGGTSFQTDSGHSPILRAGSFWENQHELSLDGEVVELVYFLQTHSGGCYGDIDTLRVLLLPKPGIFIPEVMTPNGDGRNDVWEIRHPPEIQAEEYQIEVFNRAGGKVYAQYGLAPVWDGGSLPDGVYWWIATNTRTEERLSGGLTIRRR